MIRQVAAITVWSMLASPAAHAQAKVANYSFGRPGTASYEQLSFWTSNGRRDKLYYTYGKDRKTTELTYVARPPAQKVPGLAVRFTNGHVLMIAPSGAALRVTAPTGKAPKTFTWEYEGPVGGVGTFCQECAEDEKEAMTLLRAYYLK